VDFLGKRKDWLSEESVPGLVQVLQVEDASVRQYLVQMLAATKGRRAAEALATRAVFDLDGDIRQAAVEALKGRPREDYRPVLLNAFRHPWPPAAEHAAEAVAALGDLAAAPDLAALLDRSDPAAPYCTEDGLWVLTEMVRINHLGNCLLCHASSDNPRDPLRGLAPKRGDPLPPEVYYDAPGGNSVRADVTYLQQDFSTAERPESPGVWPEEQRFDYLLRKRELSPAEVWVFRFLRGDRRPASYPQREAVLFALRALTKADPGESADAWRRWLREPAGEQR
jgi:hypothetical protein